MESTMDKIKLSPDLEAYLNDVPVLSDEETKDLGDAIKALDSDPQFIAEELKEHFLNTILAEMRLQGMSKSQLASKWGKKRQYVSEVLNPDKLKNFTIDTVVELSMQVGLRVKLHLEPLGASAKNDL